MEEKLINISAQLNIVESLSRILLEIIQDGENLKKADTNNLSRIILNEIIKIKNNINELEVEMGI